MFFFFNFSLENIWEIRNMALECFYINEDIHHPINIVRGTYNFECILFPQHYALVGYNFLLILAIVNSLINNINQQFFFFFSINTFYKQ